MKKLYILLLITLFGIFAAKAQKIFPDTFAIWHEYRESIEDPDDQRIEEYSYIMQGDTQVNGKNYKVIYNTSTIIKHFKNGQLNGPFSVNINNKYSFTNRIGGVRKDSKKLYYVSFEQGNPEKLVYDYDVQQGDTMMIALGMAATVVKDSMIVGHRYFEVKDLSPRKSPWKHYIVEGMGYSHSILPIHPLGSEVEYVTTFCGDGISFGGNRTGVGGWSPIEVTGNCKKDLSAFLSVDEKTEQNITAYPNPAKNYVVVNRLYSNSLITIMDVSGRWLKEQKSANTSETIDISALPQGVYILLISNESGVLSQKIVKE